MSRFEYVFGPRRVSSVSGRVVVSLPKHLYHLRGRKVIVKLIVIPKEDETDGSCRGG